ncbi:UNKNOWN [Stylonychia lemnae]|uniref:NADAR domain-containing protein n=1 Tax=Stylonychia lemnae TaxID=5949 RepID=A0A077ZR72_STYLE|nr:UNKNOWN [Stylonychia lemnae]|eukprot:CDW72392.1 UNKNOWN [Stylonychia lemnae]
MRASNDPKTKPQQEEEFKQQVLQEDKNSQKNSSSRTRLSRKNDNDRQIEQEETKRSTSQIDKSAQHNWKTDNSENTVYFFGEKNANGYLSNFYPSPIVADGKFYPTNEHYFQANKMEREEDHETVRKASTPYQSKKLGGKLKIKEICERYPIMIQGLIYKYSQNPELMERLLATGDKILVENSPYDDKWGCGRSGTGQNLLGKALMEVRDHFRLDSKLGVAIQSPSKSKE